MPRSTQDTRLSLVDFVYGGFTLFAAASQPRFYYPPRTLFRSYNPAPACWDGLGYSPFARHYLGSLNSISFPAGT